MSVNGFYTNSHTISIVLKQANEKMSSLMPFQKLAPCVVKLPDTCRNVWCWIGIFAVNSLKEDFLAELWYYLDYRSMEKGLLSKRANVI